MMHTNQTLRGFATISYWADDMEAAKAWYSDLLGITPYFERTGPDGKLAYAENFGLGTTGTSLVSSIAGLPLVSRHPSPIHSATYLASCTMLIT
ncbi:hypothetical protein SAMN04488688_103124 [Paenibacillus sp. cl141a]|nr:hypothetical protein SAMN04488688_103124 [Paenibacillus sp. cl141a]